jgi:predicted AAA+ superfamily ATPase
LKRVFESRLSIRASILRWTFKKWGVVTIPKTQRAQILEAYTQLHLEEEMRREALVKDWPAFVRFLRLAAVESGQMVNYNKIAGDIGLSVPTVKSHYQLLEDMFLGPLK